MLHCNVLDVARDICLSVVLHFLVSEIESYLEHHALKYLKRHSFTYISQLVTGNKVKSSID